MLLEDKITALIALKSDKLEDRYDFMDNVLKAIGSFPTKNIMFINILFYLLEQQFEHDYLNREIYKKLLHFINITEIPSLSSVPTHAIAAATPSMVATPDALPFGNVVVGEESVLGFLLTTANLEDPTTVSVSEDDYTISIDSYEFVSSFTLMPDFIEKNPTLDFYVKFIPTVAEAIPGTITFTSDITVETVSLTGTGTST